MIDRKKVALMTRLAIEEKKEPRAAYIVGSFWASDYLLSELWKTFLAVTAAYAAVWGVWLLATSDTWSYTYHIADAVALFKKALTAYVPLLLFSLLLALAFHAGYYLKAYKKQAAAERALRVLNRIYKEEEKLEDIRSGRHPSE